MSYVKFFPTAGASADMLKDWYGEWGVRHDGCSSVTNPQIGRGFCSIISGGDINL